MGNALDSLVPTQLKQMVKQSGREFVYPYPIVLQVVEIATRNNISILGVEVFHALPQGFLTEAISSYRISSSDDWDSFVKRNNFSAAEFIDQNRKGEGHGYILSATSEREFRNLK